MWTALALTVMAGIAWRFGLHGLILAIAALWLAGLGWLGWRDGFIAQAGAPVTLRLWVVAGGALLAALAYAALLRAGRRAAQRRAPQGAGIAGASPPPASPAAAESVAPSDPASLLSDAELDRYARHIILRELGGAGQRRLRAARVLVVGAGGLGAPVLQYLAAAGVGRITLADDDTVALSNLQRQVIFATRDIGRPKVEAAAEAMAALNPHVAVTPLVRRITASDAALVAGHDLVLDGTDSFASRAGVNAACVEAQVPLIAGAIAQWEGQVTLADPARGGPCLACLFPEAPAPGLAPSCAEAGVVGALPGWVGSLMAIEAIKLIALAPGTGAGLRGAMVLADGLWGETRRITAAARPGCAVCGGRGAVAAAGA